LDEALWLRDRQLRQQDIVEQREDRRVRADAERERQDGDNRDEGRPEEGPQRESWAHHERVAPSGQMDASVRDTPSTGKRDGSFASPSCNASLDSR